MSPIAVLENPFDLFAPVFAQRALAAVLLLAVIAAALGWAIVLRDLPFFTHAIGAGAYPVLVLGVIAGVSIALSALAGALLFALCLAVASGVGRTRSTDAARRDALTGLAVVAALAIGSVIAARAGSGNQRLAVPPDALLFGSLLTIDGSTLLVLAAVALAAVTAAWFGWDRWLAGGFDSAVAARLGAARSDQVLLVAVALGTGAALPVTGSLLAGALLIVPGATARMLTDSARRLPPIVFALAAAEGSLGLYLSLNYNLPTGASIAAVAGAAFFLVAAAVSLRGARRFARPLVAAAAISLLALGAAGCGSRSASVGSPGDRPLPVVATTPQVADLVEHVGGRQVLVTTLLPVGADPHDYEPKPKAVAAIAGAGVVFRSGGDIDSWLLPAVRAADASSAPVDLSRSAILLPSGSGSGTNAHWYLDPHNVARAAQRVRDELIKADPAGRETFRANATQYLDQIDATANALRRCVGRVPASDRKLMAGHNDFAYLADAFGFRITTQIARTGESEPSASELQRAVDTARATGVRAVVASRGEATRLDQRVAAALDVPLLQLYSDNLAADGGASTLLGAIGFDVAQISAAVTGGGVQCPSDR